MVIPIGKSMIFQNLKEVREIKKEQNRWIHQSVIL